MQEQGLTVLVDVWSLKEDTDKGAQGERFLNLFPMDQRDKQTLAEFTKWTKTGPKGIGSGWKSLR